MNQPLLVLVHGAWHRAPMWDALIAQLPDTDIATVQLPSSAPASNSRLGDLHADARTIRALVEQADQPVVVCAHSYGGAPTSQALDGAAHVKRIVYLNAFMLDVGESILSAAGGHYRPHWIVDEQAGTVRIRDAESVLYGDLDPDAARQAAASLGPQSLSSIRQPLTAAAWHHIPSTYITAARDAGVPPALSRRFSRRAGKAIVLDTAHSAFFSHPVELAGVLQDVLQSA